MTGDRRLFSRGDDESRTSASRRAFIKGVGVLTSSGGFVSTAEPSAAQETQVSQNGQQPQTRTFRIHAVEVDIVYNRFGLRQPDGAMYVLEENLDAVQEASGEVPGDAFDLVAGTDAEDDEGVDTSVIEPLVIRANRGDTIEIEFVNHLDRPASIHQTELPLDPKTSDGMNVGYNAGSVAQPGETETYRWLANSEGAKMFYDGANQAYDSADEPPQEANLLTQGLFGTVMVEPPGATWTDPETGGELRSGVRAAVHGPIGPGGEETHYREFVLHYHTPEGLRPELEWPGTDVPQTVHAINYRADPTAQRINDLCEDCGVEAGFYNSWTNGDPGGGDNVYETYKGEPVKMAFVGASVEENHVHHLHNHRWKQVTRTAADTIDAQTFGLGESFQSYLVAGHGAGTVRPNMTFSEAFEVGAGYVHGNAGDVLFHCHLFPHYGEGMWGIMRIHDEEQPDLQPLPNAGEIIPSESEAMGYPDFIPTELGRLPPKAPSPLGREPTALEREALGALLPGAPYADPCQDPPPNRTIQYTLRAMNADIVYNDAGEHDPDGVFYILEEATVDGETHQVTDPADVREGRLNPEPLFIRANVGDCIEFTLINDTGREVSMHQHFVGYDVLGSDSLAAGYNYRQDTDPGEENHYRWYADEEGAIYFHDHIVGIDEVMNGTFAALIVEPTGSDWYDPYSGEPLFSGAQAMIDPPNQPSFREQCLHLQDFAQLRNQDGEFINPEVEHNENAGTMAVNFRNAPYYNRNDPDPAYVHSSQVHGDPPTPVLEAYEDDPIRFRVLQGAYEEMHNFALHGLEIDPEGFDVQDSVSQIIGPSEAHTFRVTPERQQFGGASTLENPDGLPVRDYRFGSNVVDDLWCGMWGIARILGGEADHLQPLPGGSTPEGAISEEQLAEMGHPAPFSEFDWTEYGQRAKQLYAADDDRSLPADIDARRNPNVGEVPPVRDDPGNPAPDEREPDRVYDISAVTTQIRYNRYGDVDPYGIAFVPDVFAEQVKNGVRTPDPLTIRANEGELIEVNLTNDLTPGRLNQDHPHPKMRVDGPWDRSERISLHPQRVEYDVNASDGATVGFNWDQTIGRGETITYRWYADEPLGTSILYDFADVRSNRHHGAYGQLIIEPAGSTAMSTATAEPNPTVGDAMIATSRQADFRENALLFADSQYIVNRNRNRSCVVPPGPDVENDDAPCNQLGDAEDHGYGAVNYRSEPFIRRFETGPDEQYLVYSSRVHGDPSTPVLNAVLNDPVVFRVGMAADKGRSLTFHLAGHQWQRYRGVTESPLVGVNSQFSPGKAERFDLIGGAGGEVDATGDYLYQETKERRRLESGMWGIFRVRGSPGAFPSPVQPLPDRARPRGPPRNPGNQGSRGNQGSQQTRGDQGNRTGRPSRREAESDSEAVADGGDAATADTSQSSEVTLSLAERPGYVVERFDLTDTGTDDTIVGVPNSDIGAPNGGGVYLFVDTLPSEIASMDGADLQVLSRVSDDRIGEEMSTVVREGNAYVCVKGCDGNLFRIGVANRLWELMEDPPETDLLAFMRRSSNNEIRSTVPLREIDAWRQNP